MADAIAIATYIFIAITLLISLYLILIYLMNKEFHMLRSANNIIINLIVFLDNVIRIIPMDVYILRHIQAFLLVFFDKLILATITFQTFILYFGICHTKFYFKNEKNFFLAFFLIGLITSIVLSLLYIIIGNSEKGDGGITNFDNKNKYFYVISTDFKLLSDTIFNGVFLFFNLFFTILLVIFQRIKQQKVSAGDIQDLGYSHRKIQIILIFLINSFMFVESYLIIYDKMPEDFIDLIYIITCFLVDLFHNINHNVRKKTIKIFCKDLYKKMYHKIKKKDTFGNDIPDSDDDGEDDDIQSQD